MLAARKNYMIRVRINMSLLLKIDNIICSILRPNVSAVGTEEICAFLTTGCFINTPSALGVWKVGVRLSSQEYLMEFIHISRIGS